MRPMAKSCILLSLLLARWVPALADTREFRDPNGIYTLQVPGNWVAQAQQGGMVATEPKATSQIVVSIAPRAAQGLQAFADAQVEKWKQQGANWRQLRRDPMQVAGLDGLGNSRPQRRPRLIGLRELKMDQCLLKIRGDMVRFDFHQPVQKIQSPAEILTRLVFHRQGIKGQTVFGISVEKFFQYFYAPR